MNIAYIFGLGWRFWKNQCQAYTVDNKTTCLTGILVRLGFVPKFAWMLRCVKCVGLTLDIHDQSIVGVSDREAFFQ